MDSVRIHNLKLDMDQEKEFRKANHIHVQIKFNIKLAYSKNFNVYHNTYRLYNFCLDP